MKKRTKPNIALVNLTGDIYCRGLRQLAAFLKQNGYECELIFLPGGKTASGLGLRGMSVVSDEDFYVLRQQLRDFSIVGFSAMTNYLEKFMRLGERLRRVYRKKIFILGGVAAITQPEELVKIPWLDGVCFGEGELATLELVKRLEKGKKTYSTPGYLFKKNGKIYRNRIKKLIDVDEVPYVDYSEGKLVISGNFRRVSEDDLKDFFGTTLWTSTSRGCPFRCAYCINSKLSAGVKLPRFHSADYVLGEIKLNLGKFDFFNSVYFNDESFSARPKGNLYKLLEKYKRVINLPWSCYVDPFTLAEKDIDKMIWAGLKKIKIGLQSGSKRVSNEIFNRPFDSRRFRQILRRLQGVEKRISLPIIDVICDVPWVMKEDLIKEVKFLNSLPRPFSLEVFSLSIYPGSVIYEKAAREGFGDRVAKDFVAGSSGFYGGVFLRLISLIKIPDGWMEFLVRSGWIFSRRSFSLWAKFFGFLVMARKLVGQLRSGDATLLPYFLGRIAGHKA